MSYDEALAERVRSGLAPRPGVTERKMFGGIAWMIGGNMACGVLGEDLIVRLPREEVPAALEEPGTRPFDATGRPMGGFVLVEPSALADPAEFERWLEAGAGHAASLPPK